MLSLLFDSPYKSHWPAGAGIGYIFGFLAGIVFLLAALYYDGAWAYRETFSPGSIVLVGWVCLISPPGICFGDYCYCFCHYRSQTYGMKQALWKLIVAALLVTPA